MEKTDEKKKKKRKRTGNAKNISHEMNAHINKHMAKYVYRLCLGMVYIFVDIRSRSFFSHFLNTCFASYIDLHIKWQHQKKKKKIDLLTSSRRRCVLINTNVHTLKPNSIPLRLAHSIATLFHLLSATTA